MPGCGKGTCTGHLEGEGYPVVHFGNMIYDEVQRRGLGNVKDEKFVREDLRAKEGKEVLAKLAANKAEEHFSRGQEVVVFDGLYSWSELKYLRVKYGDNLIVIALVGPRKIRYQRILNREDKHRKYENEQQIIDRDIAEIENLEKGGPIAFADYYILNNAGIEDVLISLDKLLTDLEISQKG